MNSLIIIIREITRNMYKNDLARIGNFKKTMSKGNIIEHMVNTFTEKDIKAICKSYPMETALKSNQVAQFLECTKTEIMRWTAENKLRILYQEDFRKYGKHLI